jgi:hypothetical protein
VTRALAGARAASRAPTESLSTCTTQSAASRRQGLFFSWRAQASAVTDEQRRTRNRMNSLLFHNELQTARA